MQPFGSPQQDELPPVHTFSLHSTETPENLKIKRCAQNPQTARNFSYGGLSGIYIQEDEASREKNSCNL